ncbi:NAD(P)/FAD-dependent oxidoreductase [Acinetobacter guerrae]|uniref:NAD(P)/FAD-dependent oxidoreductase n=1 Tax=Acinetobacter guerrae TaxID=1843371 RepID=A0A3A8EA35_9GAMM|nr:NAD(P)/FAD-dependent oxidoreductase [Acinetobacter guerrae]RKG30988.1 NAD(P)/FAD-dependent oxidoreductase [Acinetobacter guerrae]
MMTTSNRDLKLHRIVIVGGGAGGLELATRLGNKLGKRQKAEIILVDAALTHIWKPLLHEVAAGTLNSYEDELNYFAHANQHHFEFFLGHLKDIDRQSKEIILDVLRDEEGKDIAPERRIGYDTLVMAIGSTSNDFGTSGAKEHCIFLDSRPQADRFQREFLSMYIEAQANHLMHRHQNNLNIAIIGAGATGVELAAELHHAANEFSKYGLNSIDPKDVNISLIEAAPRILPALNERVSERAQKELEDIGVKVLTNCRVTHIDADKVFCEGDLQIAATLKVWSAGIKAPDFLKDIAGLETNRINQLVVRPSLQTTYDDSIFAMGDCACYIPEGQERPVPPRAQVANQEAIFLAKALENRLNHKPLGQFQFKDKGSLVSLSEHSSVGSIFNNINVEGFVARMMYVSLYRFHQVALHGVFKTALMMMTDLLSKTASPKLKMH